MRFRPLPFVSLIVLLRVVPVGAAETPCAETAARARKELDAGKLVAASRSFSECARDRCPAERAECARKVEEVDRSVPTTSFVVKDSLDHDLDATIVVDGGGPLPVGRAVALDPGVHDVSWFTTAGEGGGGARKITLVEGQKFRVVVLSVETKPREEKTPATKPAGSAVPWVLFGSGAALVTMGALLEVLAVNEANHSHQLLYHASRADLSNGERRAFFDSSVDHYDAATVDEGLAITCFALGTAAIVAGVVWVFTRDGTSKRVGLGTF